MQPFVSIIIPAKNVSRWLPLCLEAIVKQDYPRDKYETLVIDNGSTDNTVQIAKDFGVRVLKEPELNIAGLRNYGASMAKGDLYAFIDADVVISRRWMTAAINCLTEDEKVGCAGSFPLVPEDFGWVAKSWWYLQVPQRSSDKSEVEWLPSMNMVVRKEAFQSVKGFSIELITCEDVDFCYRLGKNFRIIYCEKMSAIHYGEARNLRQLFRKERWRGLSNYEGIRHHGLRRDEIHSLLLPLFYLVLGLWISLSLVTLHWMGALGGLAAATGPPLLKAYLQASRFGNYRMVPLMTIVCLVYCVARTVGAMDWLQGKLIR